MDCGFRCCLLLLGPLRNILNEPYSSEDRVVFFFQVLNCFSIRGLGIAVAFHMLSESEMDSFLGH